MRYRTKHRPDGVPEAQWLGCVRKEAEATEAEALARAKRIRKRYSKRLWPYRCHYCGQWHLTSQRPRKEVTG